MHINMKIYVNFSYITFSLQALVRNADKYGILKGEEEDFKLGYDKNVDMFGFITTRINTERL